MNRSDRQAVRNLRRQRRELMEQRPDTAPFQQRIWDLLSEDQQGWLSNKLDNMRKEQAQRRPGQRPSDGAARIQRRADADGLSTPVAKAGNIDTPSTQPVETESRSSRRVRFLEANRSRQGPVASDDSLRRGAKPTSNDRTFEFDNETAENNEN